jgi:hypothetical protein
MTEELQRLIQELRDRSMATVSYAASFTSSYSLQLMPFEAKGTTYFLSPDKHRAETIVKENKIIAIRRGALIYRILSNRKEIWKYDLRGLPQAEPINFAVADLRSPFYAVTEATIEYEGTRKEETFSQHIFTARIGKLTADEVLDTRKGFTIPFQPKALDVQVHLGVDAETGLLRNMTGTAKSGEHVFRAEYVVERINSPMDESLFELDESTATYKVIDMSVILASAMNPDAALDPPSVN